MRLVSSHTIVFAVARGCRPRRGHLGCTPEDAKLRIVGKAEAAWVRVCGVTSEGYEVSLLPASCRGIDWDAVSLPPCEITNISCPRVRSRTSSCALMTSLQRSAAWEIGRAKRVVGSSDTRVDHSKRTGGMDP